MPERTISPWTYLIVDLVLVLLTVITVAVSFAPMAGVWHIVCGLVVAVAKAALVVLFFMHLLLSPRLTWSVVVVVIFWLGILLVLTLSDYMSRDMIRYMFGH
ncbi:MAG TPA: cytochrome C oxidase subunit IV family protein [Gemmataceae bacterium]|nr:cytochrome C oxidase subunit IV family protein [Gemmataceae bacterium]